MTEEQYELTGLDEVARTEPVHISMGTTGTPPVEDLWTPALIDELEASIARVKELEAQRKRSVYTQESNRCAAFFTDLQAVLRKHNACVFAKPCESTNKYAEVHFQFLSNDPKGDHFKVNSKRSHSSAGEFDWLAKNGGW